MVTRKPIMRAAKMLQDMDEQAIDLLNWLDDLETKHSKHQLSIVKEDNTTKAIKSSLKERQQYYKSLDLENENLNNFKADKKKLVFSNSKFVENQNKFKDLNNNRQLGEKSLKLSMKYEGNSGVKISQTTTSRSSSISPTLGSSSTKPKRSSFKSKHNSSSSEDSVKSVKFIDESIVLPKISNNIFKNFEKLDENKFFYNSMKPKTDRKASSSDSTSSTIRSFKMQLPQKPIIPPKPKHLNKKPSISIDSGNSSNQEYITSASSDTSLDRKGHSEMISSCSESEDCRKNCQMKIDEFIDIGIMPPIQTKFKPQLPEKPSLHIPNLPGPPPELLISPKLDDKSSVDEDFTKVDVSVLPRRHRRERKSFKTLL